MKRQRSSSAPLCDIGGRLHRRSGPVSNAINMIRVATPSVATDDCTTLQHQHLSRTFQLVHGPLQRILYVGMRADEQLSTCHVPIDDSIEADVSESSYFLQDSP
jgi:hypothetical protein